MVDSLKLFNGSNVNREGNLCIERRRAARTDFVIACLLLSACTERMPRAEVDAAFAEAISVCPVIADKHDRLGQTLMLSGEYGSNPEYSWLSGRDCPDKIFELRGDAEHPPDPRAAAALGRAYRNDPKRVRVEVVLRATVARRHRIDPCADDGCYQYYLEHVQVVAARP